MQSRGRGGTYQLPDIYRRGPNPLADMDRGVYIRGESKSAVTPGKLKSLPDHGGNRTHDLWDTSPMLCQLSYEVKSFRVGDISELSLVLSIPEELD